MCSRSNNFSLLQSQLHSTSCTHLETEIVDLDFDLAIPATVRFDINPFVGALAVCLGLWCCCWKVKSKVFCCFYQLFFLDDFLSIILATFLPLLIEMHCYNMRLTSSSVAMGTVCSGRCTILVFHAG